MDAIQTNGVHQDFTFLSLIQHADPVVQAVILLLFMCSVASWAIILAKIGSLAALSTEIGGLENWPMTRTRWKLRALRRSL